ncbi:hypothetical protein QZH41_002678 [Actinostola sp. cb2023]|nr:hypothetical protein QZH41_002678 [Actinostola sp. cb2023]
MNNSQEDGLLKFATEMRNRPLALVIFEATIFAILEFLAIAGNSLTLYVIWKAPRLRTRSNYFVACLAVSDLGLGVLTEHLLLSSLIMARWPFGDAACQYQGVVAITMATASLQTLAWTALNRYFRIVQTKCYYRVFTRKNMIIIFVFIWVSSAFSPLPYLMAGKKFIFHPGKFFCYLTLGSQWYQGFLGIYIGIPAIVIVFCYYKISRTIKVHEATIRRGRYLSADEIKVTRTLFIIVVVFMVCWTPISIMDAIDIVRGTWSLPRPAYAFYTFIASVNYAVNPFIYGFSNPNFRREYSRVLRCQSREGDHRLPSSQGNENQAATVETST